jgi:proteic killer suppression protein
MIRSFRSKALKRFYERGDARGLPPQFIAKIGVVLDALANASQITELNIPTFGLHSLMGDRKERWAIAVTRNWRITFRFVDVAEEADQDTPAGVYEVNYEDYH